MSCKYITYLALKTMIVQKTIKDINTIGLAAAVKAAAANPIVCRGLISLFSWPSYVIYL